MKLQVYCQPYKDPLTSLPHLSNSIYCSMYRLKSSSTNPTSHSLLPSFLLFYCTIKLTSYQLLASRLLGWGLSGPLSCFVAKGAQVPSRRRGPHMAPRPGMPLGRWGSRSPHRAPSHLRFQAGFQDDPRPSAVLPPSALLPLILPI